MLRAVRIALLTVVMSAIGIGSIKDAEAQSAAIVNGSFVNPPADWMLPGHPNQLWEAIRNFYGVAPGTVGWSPSFNVFPPFYTDIWNGGPSLASLMTGYPGTLNVVTHSHGGNAVIIGTHYMSRPLRTLINLGTPINWDLPGHLGGGSASSRRCQISSSADWVQFVGSSPYQIANFVYAIYASIAGAIAAFEALAMGDYLTAQAYFQLSVFEVIVAEYWWYTTKIEVVGPTYLFSGLSHGDLHTGPVYNAIAPACG